MSDFGGAVRQSDTYEFAIIGIPYDEKSSFLKGAAMGPAAVRKASTEAAINAWTELNVNLAEDTSVVDLGDVDVSEDFVFIVKRVREAVSGIMEKSAVPVVIGGDHSISYPVVAALAGSYPALDILHFDAHPDLYDHFRGDRYSHACPFARILEEAHVKNLVQVGIRAAIPEHRAMAERKGVTMIEMKELDANMIPELAFDNPLYISVDIDALDPAFAPGVSHHEPGGLSTRQILQFIHGLQPRAGIVGMDLVEVNGIRDTSGITAAAAVKILMEMMGKAVLSR